MSEYQQEKPLDPEWKAKLSECMCQVGLIDASRSHAQVIVNVADGKVKDATKQVRYK
jgi:hypothetical protein